VDQLLDGEELSQAGDLEDPAHLRLQVLEDQQLLGGNCLRLDVDQRGHAGRVHETHAEQVDPQRARRLDEPQLTALAQPVGGGNIDLAIDADEGDIALEAKLDIHAAEFRRGLVAVFEPPGADRGNGDRDESNEQKDHFSS
jgi:hypothetical protein